MLVFLKKKIKRYILKSDCFIGGYKIADFGKIGDHCKIGPDCILVPKNMYIDDYVIIQGRNNFISYKGKLVIKRFSVISSSCIIIPGNHVLSVGIPFYLNTISHVGDDEHIIVINEDVWIGAGCKILPKSSFGRGCVVATGSVVTKEIPPYAVVAGCPAKIIAVKFSKEDIIEHEKRIYPSNERLSTEQLDILFKRYYRDVMSLKKYNYTQEEENCLKDLVDRLNMDITI